MIAGFVEAALSAGTRRMVLLSGRGEEEAESCERVLMDSGADWTVLQSSWFSQNFSESYLLDPILAGALALPAGEVGQPFTDADDIAEVAATILTEDGHVGEVYELTGPRTLTSSDARATIAEATGRGHHLHPHPNRGLLRRLRPGHRRQRRLEPGAAGMSLREWQVATLVAATITMGRRAGGGHHSGVCLARLALVLHGRATGPHQRQRPPDRTGARDPHLPAAGLTGPKRVRTVPGLHGSIDEEVKE
jgi:hypothetical protein